MYTHVISKSLASMIFDLTTSVFKLSTDVSFYVDPLLANCSTFKFSSLEWSYFVFTYLCTHTVDLLLCSGFQNSRLIFLKFFSFISFTFPHLSTCVSFLKVYNSFFYLFGKTNLPESFIAHLISRLYVYVRVCVNKCSVTIKSCGFFFLF